MKAVNLTPQAHEQVADFGLLISCISGFVRKFGIFGTIGLFYLVRLGSLCLPSSNFNSVHASYPFGLLEFGAECTMFLTTLNPRVAFGPALPGNGSWEWNGADLAESLSGVFETVTFEREIPSCDVLVVVKFPPSLEAIRAVASKAAVIFAPVDYYGSCAEIDQDALMLRQCARIVVHSPRLAKYFRSYVPVQGLDHHVRFINSPDEERPSDGPILYVGVRSNLPALVDYVNEHSLPLELVVLTNPEDPARSPTAKDYGFHAHDRVRIETWSPEAHQAWLKRASVALDIKGTNFRQRHKPPTKAVDFIASGLPLAVNSDSSSAEYLSEMGFDVASPDDPERWFSNEYRQETVRFGRALTELYSRNRIAHRWARLINDVLMERRGE